MVGSSLTGSRATGSGTRALRLVLPRLGLVLLLCAIAVVPLLRGESPCSHDGGLHYYRVVAMRHALEQGLFFTRWLPDLAFGYGFPFFNYRAPLSYYLALGLHLTGLTLPIAQNLVYVLSILGAAVGTYLLARDVFGPQVGYVAAAAYAYAPYQLLDALVRGNAPESVALALLPFVLWSFRRLALKGGRCWFLAAVGFLVALYLDHNISSLLFTPLLLTYLAMLWWIYRERGEWREVALALVLALGVTSFFWLPALAEKGYVQLYLTGATRNNDFHYNFLSITEILAPPHAVDTSLMNPPLEVRTGLVQAILAGLGVVVGVAVLSNDGEEAEGEQGQASVDAADGGPGRERMMSVLFWAACSVFFVFMSTPASVWLWEHVPLLPFVQFPWRFVGRASLPVALLAGMSLIPLTGGSPRLRNGGSRLRAYASWAVAPMLVAGIVLASLPSTYPPTGYCRAEPYPTIEDVHRFERESGLVGVDPVGAYFPTWVQQRPTGSPLEEDYAREAQVSRFDAGALPGDAHVLEADYGPNRARIVVESPEPFQARYLSFYFPGWRASVDGERVEIAPSDPEGLITFHVPGGRHEVLVRFGETPLRRATDAVSALCLVVLLGYLAWPGLVRLVGRYRGLMILGGIAVVTTLFLLALAFNVTPYLRGPEEWRWSFGIPGRPERYVIPVVALATYVIVVVVWGGRVVRERGGSRGLERGFLALVVLSVPVIQVSLLATEGSDVVEPLFYRTVSPLSSGVFSVGSTIGDAAGFLRSYPERMPSFPVHPQRYPPGLPLIFYGARRFLEHFPGLSDLIAYPLRLRQCHNLALMRLPNVTIASAVVQMALPLVCGLVVLPLYGLARRMAGRRVAVWAAALYPLVPSFNLWFARWDAFYALLAASVWFLFAVGLVDERRLALLAAGLVLSAGSFLSFGVLALLLPMACWVVLRYVASGERKSWGWLLGGGAIFGAGLVIPWALYQAAFGHGFLDIWRVSMSYHLGLKRDYWVWLGYHLYDFFVFLGIPLAMLFLLSLFDALRDPGGAGSVLSVGFAMGVVLLDLSGTARGEVARVWLFLTPLATLVAARGLSCLRRSRLGFAVVAVLMAAQLLTFNAFLRVVTTGLTDPPDPQRVSAQASIQTSVEAHLGEHIDLLGYDVEKEQIRPGETLDLTLYWQSTAPVSQTYTVFTHLLTPEGQIIGQQDNMPVGGEWPTTCWVPGEIVADPYQIEVAPETEAEVSTLVTGMYVLESGKRLPTQGPSATTDGRVVLTEVPIGGR